MLRIPLLRKGKPYWSLEEADLVDGRTGKVMARVSQANSGLIGRDLLDADPGENPLNPIPVRELIAITREAAELFLKSRLPLGDEEQGPDDYLDQLSRTTGLPVSLARRNMMKIHSVMAHIEEVLKGLTRNLDLSILDEGFGVQGEQVLSFLPETRWLGAVLPSNSPGVHGLWIPAVALKTCLCLKPGREEPWSPYRIVQAFIRAGAPPEAFSLYPSDHAGAGEILRRTERSFLFGGASTTRPWIADPRVQIHGPGYSKVILGRDSAERWRDHLDMLEASVLENGGRSCINASGIWTPAHGRELAQALAERLVKVQPLPPDDPGAALAGFTNRKLAEALDAAVEKGLQQPGAVDLTAGLRGAGSPRLVEKHGCTYLLPTVIFCDDPEHPLAGKELLFPYVSVVQVPQDEILSRIGKTLVVTAITGEEDFRRALLTSPNIDRLNFGGIPTCRISWDQPHEGNLFQHLYRQRALQHAL